jgi:hypothetical protein
MIVKDNNSSHALTIHLDLARFMIYLRHRLPTTKEIATIKHTDQVIGCMLMIPVTSHETVG